MHCWYCEISSVYRSVDLYLGTLLKYNFSFMGLYLNPLFYSIELLHVSVLVPCCLDHYGSVVYYRYVNDSSTILFAHDLSGLWDILCLHVNF